MTKRIKFAKKPVVVKKTISIPPALFDASIPRAAEFESYSEYVQELIKLNLADKLIAPKAA